MGSQSLESPLQPTCSMMPCVFEPARVLAARDYAKRDSMRRRSKRTRKGKNPFVLVIFGLVLGIAGMCVFYLHQHGKFQFQSPILQKTEKVASAEHKARKTKPKALNNRPKFDFYTLLPQDEVIVNDKRETAAQKAAAALSNHKEKLATMTPPIEQPKAEHPKAETPAASIANPIAAVEHLQAKPKAFFIQAGAFKQQREAEEFKARLALYGYRAEIQATQSQQERRYHVVLGPFGNRTTADVKRHQLAKNQISSFVFQQ